MLKLCLIACGVLEITSLQANRDPLASAVLSFTKEHADGQCNNVFKNLEAFIDIERAFGAASKPFYEQLNINDHSGVCYTLQACDQRCFVTATINSSSVDGLNGSILAAYNQYIHNQVSLDDDTKIETTSISVRFDSLETLKQFFVDKGLLR